MDDFRLTLTVGPDYTEADAEHLLSAALDSHSELGPVTSLERSTGALSLTIAFEGDEAQRAIAYGAGVVDSVFKAAGLERRKVVGVELELAEDEAEELATA